MHVAMWRFSMLAVAQAELNKELLHSCAGFANFTGSDSPLLSYSQTLQGWCGLPALMLSFHE